MSILTEKLGKQFCLVTACVSYRLAALIYFGAQHFCMRYIAPSGTVFFHDSMLGSRMVSELRDISGVDLANCHGKSVQFVLYAIQLES